MMREARTHHARRQSGIALLLVVWITTLLTVIAGEFIFSARVKARAERNKLDELEALALAIAGYKAAVATLDADIDVLELDAEDRLKIRYRGEPESVAADIDDVPL